MNSTLLYCNTSEAPKWQFSFIQLTRFDNPYSSYKEAVVHSEASHKTIDLC